MNMIDATTLALFGVGISVGLGAAGSSLGSGAVAKVGASLLSKQPQKFPQALVLAALPSSQALYGFLYGIIILLQTGLLNGAIEVDQGTAFGFLASAIPVGVAGLFSGYAQGQVAASAIKIVAEKPENLNQGIVLSALIESFAIFGLIVSILIAFVVL
jgi:V/A-type H+-transporting ATPase subunit K